MGHLPAALRARWDAMLARAPAGRIVDLLRGLSEASGQDPRRFGAMLPDTVGAGAATSLQAAARAAAGAASADDERAASAALADAVQAVGLDNWSRFVAGVQDRAAETARTAASEPPPDPRKDAITPVYPLETMIGVGVAGVAGGVGAAARAAGGALLRQLMPGAKAPETPGAPMPNQAANPEKYFLPPDRQQHILDTHGPGRNVPNKSEFPAGWTDQQVVQTVKDIANSPTSQSLPGNAGRLGIQGQRDGVDILVVIGRDGRTIVTAHPTNLPKNPL